MGQVQAVEPEIVQDDLYRTDMSVGEILRRTRAHYNQSLPDIERALRIRASQIQAIEEDRIDLLPGRVYAIGFVRSYAEYLGLDGEKMVRLFKRQSGSNANKPALDFPVPASESKIPASWLVVVSILTAVLLLSGWLVFGAGDRSVVDDIPSVSELAGKNNGAVPDMIPPVGTPDIGSHSLEEEIEGPVSPQGEDDRTTGTAESLAQDSASDSAAHSIEPAAGNSGLSPQQAPVGSVNGEGFSVNNIVTSGDTGEPEDGSLNATVGTEGTGTAGAETAETGAVTDGGAPPVVASKEIILNIIRNSWVEIRDQQGIVLVSRVLDAGEQYFVPSRADLSMSVGNAGGIEIEIDGRVLGALGDLGQVKRDISLDATSLKQQYPSLEATGSTTGSSSGSLE